MLRCPLFWQPVCDPHKTRTMIAATRHCLNCHTQLHGRTDKKFCNDYCRNTHHNSLNSDGNSCMRNINHCLRKNRRILENLLQGSRPIARFSKQVLQNKGFSFQYFTHQQVSRKGNPVYFCYDYGYRFLEKEQVLISGDRKEN